MQAFFRWPYYVRFSDVREASMRVAIAATFVIALVDIVTWLTRSHDVRSGSFKDAYRERDQGCSSNRIKVEVQHGRLQGKSRGGSARKSSCRTRPIS